LLLSFDVDVGFTDVVALELDLLVALTDDKVLSELFELDLLVVELVLVATGAVNPTYQ
jgi:hypothetical protein